MFDLSELVFLKDILGIKGNDKDITLQFVLSDVKQIIKNYCHVKEVPEELNTTALKMAIDLYRNQNLGEEETPLGSISSITEGDTSISYRSNAAEFKDRLLNDYKAQLNKYRKLVW
ncbi:phage head-tail connector protein [Clostridium tetani]|uniref:phage head-tail connector protein n=1 Tax=Clostridium tetani TaxID=1513 RepID=UPI0024A94D68|nr:phage head-tail connector protein [Clostridium tetani]